MIEETIDKKYKEYKKTETGDGYTASWEIKQFKMHLLPSNSRENIYLMFQYNPNYKSN